jgi:Cu(I)/Ag(I) efflux system membrane protein CusA/SilA
VDTLSRSLLIEIVIVSLVVIVFLAHARSAMVAVLILPLGVLIAFLLMRWHGLNANIMSLGGIAITIGAMVDGAIVMVENAHKHMARDAERKGAELSSAERWQAVGAAAREVGPALFFSLLVITVAFLPVFSMQAQEGRLFSPLAFTATYAMAGAAILAITLVPVLMGYLVRGRIRPEESNPINRWLHRLHTPLLGLAMRWRWATVVMAGLLLAQQTDRILREFPEVGQVFGKAGRAETATDPAPLAMFETTIRLKPRREWPDPTKTTRELIDEMDRELKLPGLANSWTMPIKARIDMLSTGIKTPVGIKVSGPDLEVLQRLSQEIEIVMSSMPETLSAFGDRAVGGYYMDFDIDRTQAARYGLTVGDVQDVIQSAIGGMNVTATVEGLERYPVNVRYPRELRDTPDALRRVLIATPTGVQIPLEAVADISMNRGAPVIKSENGRPNAWIYVDPRTSDIGGFVAKAQRLVAQQVAIPAGYTIRWSGQYEYMERARTRLQILVPVTLLAIFLLLYGHFRNVLAPAVVMLSIPFGLIGGVWLTFALGYNLSVAVAVGFIALAGMAAEIGVLVLSFIDAEIARLRGDGGRLSAAAIREAARSATAQRVRPVVMTAASTMAGLLPIMLSSGTGSDVTHRIAAPMLGGMLTVMILNLLVLPVIYSLALQHREKRLGSEGTRQSESSA